MCPPKLASVVGSMNERASDNADASVAPALAIDREGGAAGPAALRIQDLSSRYAALDGEGLLRPLIEHEFPGRLAVVSSFGAESAIVLALVAAIDRRIPILFLDTRKLFGETLRYRDRLIATLRLEDVRTISPAPHRLASADPEDMLWQDDPDRCCALRKAEPLTSALQGFDAWVSGRKRYHGAARAELPPFEAGDDGRIKINPVARWSRRRVEEEFAARDLPRHPLEADGYLSIGCVTCTDRVLPGEDCRAGRWRGHDKVECGIHLPSPGHGTR